MTFLDWLAQASPLDVLTVCTAYAVSVGVAFYAGLKIQ